MDQKGAVKNSHTLVGYASHVGFPDAIWICCSFFSVLNVFGGECAGDPNPGLTPKKY